MSLKILMVLENFYPAVGGVESLFLMLAKDLVDSGHRVTVLTRHREGCLRQETYKGIRIIRVPANDRFAFTFRAIPPTCRLAGDCDLIHTTSYNAALPAIMGGLVRRRKTVITFHECWQPLWFRLPFLSFPQRLAYYLFEKMLLLLPFSAFVGVSDSTCRRLTKYSPWKKKVRRIYNGIPYEDFSGYRHRPPEGRFRFLYFGRAGVSKGLDLLLPAFSHLLDSHPGIELLLLLPEENGPVRKWVDDYLLKERSGKAITISPPQKDAVLFDLIANCSAVVIPSHSEGFCFAAVESQAIGAPVVATPAGALPEVLGGRYIMARDITADALRDAMESAVLGRWRTEADKMYPLSETLAGYLRLFSQLAQ